MAEGISTLALASRIMQRYDRNDDGVIDLNGNNLAYFANEMSESVVAKRKLTYNTYETPYSRDIVYTGFTEEKVSLSKLFRSADTNKDLRVDRDELQQAIRLFDKDGNDRIDADPDNHWSEMKDLQRTFPEARTAAHKSLRYGFGDEIQRPGTHDVDITGSVYDLPKKKCSER